VFARLVLVVGAPGFIAFALLVDEARSRLPGAATALRAIAVGAGASALLLMALARWPLDNLQPVVLDTPEQRTLSPFRYLARTNWDHKPLSTAWAPLDEITRGSGLTVYQASDWGVFWTASTFGSELQNRIWNFARDPAHPPEVFLFHSRTGTPFYLGPAIPRETVAFDPRFRLIAASGADVTTLYVSVQVLAEHDRMARLARYYRLTDPLAVATTEKTLRAFDRGAVLLARFPFAAGYLVHEAEGRLEVEMHPVAVADFDRQAAAWPNRVVYTTGRPIPNRPSRVVGLLEEEGAAPVPLLRHEPAIGKEPVR
jgi:hypothetical protein